MRPGSGRNHPTRYWHRIAGGRVQCDVCPRECKLREGQRGLCFVRACAGGEIVLSTYGRSSGFCVDPIEKKPLNHFLPGTPVLSFGTAGCNLACKFCQNWDISKSREVDTLADGVSPEALAHAAERLGYRSVAYTYNDPVIFLEYAVDVARACHARGIKSVAVSAGYINALPRSEVLPAHGRRQHRSQGIRRMLLLPVDGRPSRPGARNPVLARERDRHLARNHHSPHPRRKRFSRRTRRVVEMDIEGVGTGSAAALHRLPPGLEDERLAAHSAHSARDAFPRPCDSNGQRAALRLHRQCSRHQRRQYPLLLLRSGSHRARLV